MSGAKSSKNAEVHLELVAEELKGIQSWPSDKTFSRTIEAPKVLYAIGATPARFNHLWDLYKEYKAAAGADAKTFSSWYKERLLETFSPGGEVSALRGKVESAIKSVEDAKPVVVTLATKLRELKKFKAMVKQELADIKAGKMKKSRGQDKWSRDAKAHLVPSTLIVKKVKGRYAEEGWAASADAAARAWGIELKRQQEAVGTADAEEGAAEDAAGDVFNAIVKTLMDHELDACRGLDAKQLKDRLWPRAKALAAHYLANAQARGRANAASGSWRATLAAAHKATRASRLGREYRAAGYVPHNNDKQTQAARRAEGIYDGADLFAALTGIGQP